MTYPSKEWVDEYKRGRRKHLWQKRAILNRRVSRKPGYLRTKTKAANNDGLRTLPSRGR